MLKIRTTQIHSNDTIILGVLSLSCFALSVFRCIYTGTGLFLSLNWNLFLAFIPWALSRFAIYRPAIQNNKFKFGILFAIWLLFFPNAPYILTDLFHLQVYSTMPLWFDLILILFFAWTGLLFGFLSLRNIEQMLKKRMNRKLIPALSVLLLFIGSFGVYLGRYLRWNSWDLLRDPFGLIYSIGDRFANPKEYIGTWGMTILMGVLLNMMYWTFQLLKPKAE
jgi:uncharacterized membrane protein